MNGYTSAVDGGVRSLSPLSSYGSATSISVVNGLLSGQNAMLLRFDDLFGNGPNQIPFGSKITSASLRIGQHSGGAGAASASLHRMLVRWDANATALTLSTSGPGLQRDDVEARQTADATLSGLGGLVPAR